MVGSTLLFLVCDNPKVVSGTGRLSRLITSNIILSFGIVWTQLVEIEQEQRGMRQTCELIGFRLFVSINAIRT